MIKMQYLKSSLTTLNSPKERSRCPKDATLSSSILIMEKFGMFNSAQIEQDF